MLHLKIFIRRRDTAHSILAIALLIAILTSASALIGYLNAQIETLAGLRRPAGKYIIVSDGSISGSRLDSGSLESLQSLQHIDSIVMERYVWPNMTFNSKPLEIPARGVSNVESFLKSRRAYLNGSAARNVGEAVVGELAANAYSINIGAEICMTYDARSIVVTVTGIFKTQTELDSEMIMPIEAAFNLTGKEYVSLIEFSLKKGIDAEKALAEILKILPEGVKVIQVQQLNLFAQQINIQMLNFLRFWSLAVCAVAASASYVAAARLVEESSYEILLIRILGIKRANLFALILLYAVVVAAVSSILGISIGLVGTQVFSVVLSWLTPSVRITPLLDLWQAAWILLTAISSAVVGCLYPAYKTTKVKYAEKPFVGV